MIMKTTTRFQSMIAACVLLLGLLIAADVTLHVVQAQRIQNLQTVLSATRNTDAASYQSLLNKYTKLYDQLTHEGIVPSQTAPTNIEPLAGAAGRNGADGHDATDNQVFSAVGSYCAVRAFCVGAKGDKGDPSTVPGPPGQDSTVAGPQGPAGQDGATVVGPQGSPGVDGRGISSLSCQDDGTWLVTYTDSTTQVVQGPCKAEVSTPSETPQPSIFP